MMGEAHNFDHFLHIDTHYGFLLVGVRLTDDVNHEMVYHTTKKIQL